MYDDHGNMIDRFDSIREAQDLYQCSHISSVCRGRRNRDGGYVWRYEIPKDADFLPPKPRRLRRKDYGTKKFIRST